MATTEKSNYGALEEESGVPPYTNPSEDAEAPPPTYHDTADSAPPPTYDSLFGQIKEARTKSSGSADFLKSVCFIIFSTIGFTIFIAFMLCIPVAMIVVAFVSSLSIIQGGKLHILIAVLCMSETIKSPYNAVAKLLEVVKMNPGRGALNLNNCPLERFIPIWLIVAGSVSAFMQLGSIIKKIKARCEGVDESEEESSSVMNGFNGLLGCFNIAWFFAGNVWVYRKYMPSNTSNINLPEYCDHTTYYFAFWLITTAYIILAFICCCSCCIAIGGRKAAE